MVFSMPAYYLGFPIKSLVRRDYISFYGVFNGTKGGGDKGRAIRNPILVTHLRALCIYFGKHYTIQDGLMLKAAVTLAIFGMLRCREYTSPTETFCDPQVNLGYQEVKFQAGGKNLTVNIKASKTDPFQEGHKIRLVMLDCEFCPVTALKHYYKSLHHTAGPLFQHEDGTYLTRWELSSIIKQCFTEEVNLNTHSFRIGGIRMPLQRLPQGFHILLYRHWGGGKATPSSGMLGCPMITLGRHTNLWPNNVSKMG